MFDEYRVRDLSEASLDAFDDFASWSYFLNGRIAPIRVSTFACAGVKEALAWHRAIMKLPVPVRMTLEGNVTTPDVLVWLAGTERRIDPDCRWLKIRDAKLDGPTLLDALKVLDRFIPCTDRERADGWHKRLALELLVGPTIIYGPDFLRQLFFIPG